MIYITQVQALRRGLAMMASSWGLEKMKALRLGLFQANLFFKLNILFYIVNLNIKIYSKSCVFHVHQCQFKIMNKFWFTLLKKVVSEDKEESEQMEKDMKVKSKVKF